MTDRIKAEDVVEAFKSNNLKAIIGKGWERSGSFCAIGGLSYIKLDKNMKALYMTMISPKEGGDIFKRFADTLSLTRQYTAWFTRGFDDRDSFFIGATELEGKNNTENLLAYQDGIETRHALIKAGLVEDNK